jgi:hypothetical protein
MFVKIETSPALSFCPTENRKASLQVPQNKDAYITVPQIGLKIFCLRQACIESDSLDGKSRPAWG